MLRNDGCQTAGQIEMSLCTEVDNSQDHIILDGVGIFQSCAFFGFCLVHRAKATEE